MTLVPPPCVRTNAHCTRAGMVEDKQTQAQVPRGDTRDFGTMTTASLDDDDAAAASECQQRKKRKRLGTSFCHDSHNTSTSRPLLFAIIWTLLRRAYCELGFQAGAYSPAVQRALSLPPCLIYAFSTRVALTNPRSRTDSTASILSLISVYTKSKKKPETKEYQKTKSKVMR